MLFLYQVCLALAALPRVVVLSDNSPISLLPLLRSIDRSEPRSDPIDLHVCFGVDDSRRNDDVRQRAVERLHWTRGELTYTWFAANQTRAARWLKCMKPRSTTDQFVALDASTVLASHALQWIANAYAVHAKNEETFGFSLQRCPTCTHALCARREIDVPWNVREYKHAALDARSYAPVAQRWLEFVNWYATLQQTAGAAGTKPLVGADTTLALLMRHFVEYCGSRRLYTIYYHHPTPLALMSRYVDTAIAFAGSVSTTALHVAANALVHHDVTPINERWLPTPRVTMESASLAPPTVNDQIVAIVAEMKRVAARGQLPLLTFLNNGFRNMTRHFFCNLRAVAPELFSSFVIVVLDAHAYSDLLALRSQYGERFAVLPLVSDTSDKLLLFGTRAYFEMLLVRSELIAAITAARVPLFLFECDVTVRENFIRTFTAAATRTGADFVGVQDNLLETTKHPNGGFLLMTNHTGVATAWQRIVAQSRRELDTIDPTDVSKNRKMMFDQAMLRAILLERNPIATAYIMDRSLYRSGQSLDDAKQTAAIAKSRVVLLNYAIGNDAKRRRALRHKLWFYDEANDRCITP